MICPSAIALVEIRNVLPSTVQVGAQNIGWDSDHALTGEISASAVKESGASFAMVGHSERRTFLGETNQQVVMKVQTLIAHALTALICIGETYEERLNGKTEAVLREQIDSLIPAIQTADMDPLIAYEPAWAITTNAQKLPADPELAAKNHDFIREYLVQCLGEKAENFELIYGAGVNPSNAAEIAALKNVQGLLVGGASQKAESFLELIGQVEDAC